LQIRPGNPDTGVHASDRRPHGKPIELTAEDFDRH
jgi:hypothetical protein